MAGNRIPSTKLHLLCCKLDPIHCYTLQICTAVFGKATDVNYYSVALLERKLIQPVKLPHKLWTLNYSTLKENSVWLLGCVNLFLFYTFIDSLSDQWMCTLYRLHVERDIPRPIFQSSIQLDRAYPDIRWCLRVYPLRGRTLPLLHSLAQTAYRRCYTETGSTRWSWTWSRLPRM